MSKILIVDPPGGWKYGWPKPCPEECIGNDEALAKHLREGGYPEVDIPLALKYSRYWENDDDEYDNGE